MPAEPYLVLADLLESASRQARLGDLQSLMRLQELWQQLAEATLMPPLPLVAAVMGRITEGLMLDEHAAPESELVKARDVASLMLLALRNEADPATLPWPSRLMKAVAGPAHLQPPTPPPAARDNPAMIDQELLRDFRAEASEHLDQIEQWLLTLQAHPQSRDQIDAIFRSLHSMKGTAGFVGLTDVQSIAHEAESLLDLARQGRSLVDTEVIESTFGALDALRQLVQYGQLPAGIAGRQQVIQRLRNAANRSTAETPLTSGAAHISMHLDAGSNSETLRIDAHRFTVLTETITDLAVAHSMLNRSLADGGVQHLGEPHLSDTLRLIHRLHDLGAELRMVSLRTTFNKMARLVHDLAQQLDKQINLVAIGETTEADRMVIEQLTDPLTHLLRNAVDHGIETSEERQRLGKRPMGEIRLVAGLKGAELRLVVSDDGRGLDVDRITARGREMGLIDATSPASPEQVIELICHPGFTTASQVGQVSGRGVGMDVVKRNIERLHGRIELQTRHGKGTRFMLSIPILPARLKVLIVRIGGETFAMPAEELVTRLAIGAADIPTTIVGTSRSQPGNIPIIHLGLLMQKPSEPGGMTALIASFADRELVVSMLVDEVEGSESIAAYRPLRLADQPAWLGGEAMRDNGVTVPVIDLYGVLQMARLDKPDSATATPAIYQGNCS